jgi:meso-butanediol dehydrogenase / (S,S)-butanediol dehydrogenase / diacetyl reductase
MGILDGKSAIVTGGGAGVGKGIALALAAEGASVVVAGRTESRLLETCAEIKKRGGSSLAFVCNVKDLAQIEACVQSTVDTFGSLDILINNAQEYDCLGFMLDVTDEAADNGWQSGPLATMRFMRVSHPHLVGGGVIVNVGSGVALAAADIARRGVYSAVKEAIRVLSRAAAVEWGPDNIRVNALMPYAMSLGVEAFKQRDPEWFDAHLQGTPLRRVGDPEVDIGRAVVVLVGPDSQYVTGTTLMVDGGQQYLR